MSDENLRLLMNLSLRGLQECMTGIPVNDYDPKLIMSDKDIYNALYFMFFGQKIFGTKYFLCRIRLWFVSF